MKVFTVHTRDLTPPVLIREGFAWGGLFLGPLWLFAKRAWIAGILTSCAFVAIGALTRGDLAAALATGLLWLIGLFGNDLRRWSLSLRGFDLNEVVVERNREFALARLFDRRPDLIADAAR